LEAVEAMLLSKASSFHPNHHAMISAKVHPHPDAEHSFACRLCFFSKNSLMFSFLPTDGAGARVRAGHGQAGRERSGLEAQAGQATGELS
jgi:hypothetical protein